MPDRTPNLNFLPPTYVASRRHWRWAKLQVAAVLLLGVGLTLCVVRVHSDLRRANDELSAINGEVAAARLDQQKLESLTQLRDQWRRQDVLLSAAGIHVESSRILMALEHVIPPETVLTDLSVDLLDEGDAQRASSLGSGDPLPPGIHDRTAIGAKDLKVTLRGLAPGEISIGNLLAALSKSPVFQRVHLSYAKDQAHPTSDRPGREFEVTFQINLASGGDVASTATDAR